MTEFWLNCYVCMYIKGIPCEVSKNRLRALKKTSNRPAKAITLQALEQRLLLDGAAVSTFADGISSEGADNPVDDALQALAVNSPLEDRNDSFLSSEFTDSFADTTPSEVVFIDNAVVNMQGSDIDDILSNIDSDVAVFYIDSSSDGVEQISAVLSQYSDIDAVHIIAHGDPGQLNLGSGILDSQSMQAEYADELASIGEALAEHGDILLYGCDFSAGEKGQAASELLSQLTGADVAASVDDTGNVAKGGDWVLEHRTGSVEARTIQAVGFAGILADTDNDRVDDVDDLDDDNDGILDSDEGYVAPVTAAIDSNALNSPGFPLNTPLQTGGTAQLNGLLNGVLDFEAELIDNGTGNSPTWRGGVQIQNDPILGGDFIFVQPRDTDEFPNDSAQYRFNFTNPVENLSFITGGINFGDTVTYEAFFQGNPVPVTAANFSDLTDGVVVQNGNELFNAAGAGGTNVDENRATLTFTQPVDQVIATTGKGNGSNNTVTLGFNAFTGNVITAPASFRDTDGDGISDHLDLDSDNDGISDLEESGADPSVVDTNTDGVYDNTTGRRARVDADGVPNAASGGVSPVDSDFDGIDDYLDLDSDDDGIPDTIEASSTAGYTTNDGDVTNDDSDGDGVLDVFDRNTRHGGNFSAPVDTDGDGVADILDTDSDNDGLDDSSESGLPLTGTDANSDGIDDGVNASYADPDGDINDPSGGLYNQGGNTSEVGFREVFANLVTVKTLVSGDATPDEGDTVTFRIVVENNGASRANNVSLTDLLPAGLSATLNNGTTSQGSYNATTGVWSVGTLANGASASLTLEGTVNVGQGGNTINNTTTAATSVATDPTTVGDDLTESVVVVANDLPVVVDPDSTPGTPSIDPLDAENIIVPAVDGAPVTIDLDDYLTDPNGDPLTITPGALPPGATFNAATNELTFVPTVDNIGDTVVPFTVDDGNGGVITPTVTIQPVNPGPDAVDQTVTTAPDTRIRIFPLANDTDPDGDPLTITEINGVTLTPGTAQTIPVPNGTVSILANGRIRVFPDVGFAGEIDVPYTIVDQDGATDSAVHTVVVPNTAPEVVDPDPTPGTPSIDPLDAENIIVPAVDGQPVTIDLDDYLTDPNGHALTITPGTLPAGASFNAATNELTFVPPVDNNGETVIAFTVDDGNGGVITPTVTIQPVNPGPDAVDQTDVTAPDTQVVIDPLSNDNDPDGDPLTIAEIGGVALTPGVDQTIPVPNGSVMVTASGTITVTPNTGYAGDIDVPYTIVDQDGATDAAVHTVEVPNTAPEAIDPDPTVGTPSIDPLNADNIIVPAVDGQPVTIDLDDYLTDHNGDPLAITAGTLPAGATFNAATNELTFLPTIDNNGDTVISFTVDDGSGGVTTPTVTMQPVNPGPDAVDQTITTTPDTAVIIDPLANDNDPDGDPLTITEIGGVALTPGVDQTITVPNGSVTITASGTITVIPNTGYAGDIDVPYTIVDQDGATDTAIHTVEVPNTEPEVVDPDPTPGTPSIDPLDANNIIVPAVDGASVTIDLDDYFSDPNGDQITVIAGALPPGATFDAATNGLTYVPATDNTGETVITFTVDDGNGGVNTSTVTFTPVNPAPNAVDQTVTTEFETPVVIDPIANDSDPDNDPLTITGIGGVALTPGTEQTITVPNATVTVATDGTNTVTPNNGFSGDINLPYSIEDQDGATSAAAHVIVVANVPPELVNNNSIPGRPAVDPADPNNILVPAVDGELVVIDLDEYLVDPEGGALTIVFDSLPPGARFNPVTNELSFIPTIDNNGDTVLPLTVTDAGGREITPTITIQPVNPAPVASPDIITTDQDTPVIVDLLANDIDPDNDPIFLQGDPVLLDPASGSLTLIGDDWVFTPAANFVGDASISYTLQDADGNTATSTHTVVVAGVIFVNEFDPVTVEAPPQSEIERNEFQRNFYRAPFEVELIILTAVDNLAALDDTGESIADNLQTRPLAESVEGSTGYSSGKGYRGTNSVDPTDECGRFFIDTIVNDEMLSLIARSTIDPETSSGVTRFSATLANGEPLPEWVSIMADGEYVIDRSVDMEFVVLKITAHRAGAMDLIRVIEIDTLTGEIIEMDSPPESISSSFEELSPNSISIETAEGSSNQ